MIPLKVPDPISHMRLVIDFPERAVFKPYPGTLAFFGAFCLIIAGIGLTAFMMMRGWFLSTWSLENIPAIILWILKISIGFAVAFGSLVVLGLFLAGLFAFLSCVRRRIVFDRFTGRVTQVTGLLGRKRREFPLRDLAGLELLEMNAGPSWQLHLLFANPPQYRLLLTHDNKLDTIRRAAQSLADFLRCPVSQLTLSEQAQQAGDWTVAVRRQPVHDGGTNFRTHTLTLDHDRAVFRATRSSRGLFLVFFGPGCLALLLVIPVAVLASGLSRLTALIPLVLGSAFVLVSWFFLRERPITFSRPDARAVKLPPLGFEAPLSDIRAVQVLRKYVSGDSEGRGFDCWELNLVLAHLQRVNVLAHGDGSALLADARRLADFLHVPFLDHAGDPSGPSERP